MFKKLSTALVAVSLVTIAQPASAQGDEAESIKAAALTVASKLAKRGSLSADQADCMVERCGKSEGDGNRYISIQVPRPNNPDHVHPSDKRVATKPKKRQ